ncbi:MAG TPA: TonB-dependent siderophore receptor [Burkholderiales bacterium]|nr:TonB-dependent siderophore receptor [Burkholderiales bacterium]
MNRRLTPIAAALVTVFATPIAFQQAFAQSTPSATTLPEVKVQDQSVKDDYAPAKTTIGGKAPALIRDIPQSVTIINRAVLDSQAATSLTDALRNVPGITLSAGEGGAIGDNINIRGYSARTDLFLDGMRDRGQYARETFFLDSVEVLKGPSSMLFGRGSTGGVINQVSKQATLQDISEVGLGVGTDSYYRATADLNRKMSDTSAFRIAAVAHTNESTRDVVESKRYGIAPSLRFGIGTPTELTISSVHQRREDIPDYGVPYAAGGTKASPAKPIDVNENNFYGFTDDNFEQDVDVLNVRVEHKFSPTLSLRNQTQFNSARIDASPTTITNVGVRNRRDREVDDKSLFNQTDLIANFATGAVKHTVVAGLEVGREYYENQGYDWIGEPNQSLTSPVYGPMPASVVRNRTTFTDNESDTIAVYVNDQIELSKQWKLVGGVRRDQFDFESTVTDSNTGAVNSQISRKDRMTSVRGGVIFQPTDTQSYYASYGTSFNPSAETLVLSAANQSVSPEKNRSYEVGAKWDLLEGGLGLNAALFRVDKTNARTTDSITGFVTLDGDIRVDGFEFSAAGRITPKWRILAGYTYLDGEILESTDGTKGNTLQNTPEHSASLWTAYNLTKAWEIGGGVVYSSERFTNNGNTAEVGSYTRFDATVAYIQKSYDVRLNLLNLSDEKYFEVASGGRATPAAGRSAVATLTYRF